MPRYEYRCHVCDSAFEIRRPMSQSDAPAPCPNGHLETAKLLSTVSVAAAPGAGAAPESNGGGGCCGGACGCG